MTVGRLEREMSSAELAGWMAFSRIEPLGARRLDFAAALISCVAGNPWRDKALQVDDLMPVWEDATPGEVKTMLEDVRAFVVALGAEPPARKPGKGQRPKRQQKPAPPAGSPPAGAKRGDVHLTDPRNDPGRNRG